MTVDEVVELIRPLCDQFAVDPRTVSRIVITPEEVSVKYVRNGYAEWASVSVAR